ncbi:hypothetical protein HDU67_008855 [Dinochytrium kinnereticum]|nr:hypothetical protein HDU67_008855 [Dinochytrium kinnereticum]
MFQRACQVGPRQASVSLASGRCVLKTELTVNTTVQRSTRCMILAPGVRAQRLLLSTLRPAPSSLTTKDHNASCGSRPPHRTIPNLKRRNMALPGRHHSTTKPDSAVAAPSSVDKAGDSASGKDEVVSAKLVPRMLIGFTCKVCNHRNNKLMTKKAYETGVVIIICDGCNNKHLIADHLGWFDTTQGPLGTIEDIMSRKGEQVVRLRYEASSSGAGDGGDGSLRFARGDEADVAGVERGSTHDSGMMEWLPKLADRMAEEVGILDRKTSFK